MFANIHQPSSVSLFSSTGSEPLQLWSLNLDTTVPTGSSAIQLLHDSNSTPAHGISPHANTSTSLIAPPALVELGGAPVVDITRNTGADSEEVSDTFTGVNRGYELDQTVLHIQSPKLPKTYIQCPPGSSASSRAGRSPSLGLKYPWMHLHVRNLGREWSFEVGIVDLAGRTGVLRLSTFQNRPRLKLNRTGRDVYPLLHLPLSFPSRSSRPLTAWTTINLHLPTFIPYFSHSYLLQAPDDGQEDQGPPSSKSWESIDSGRNAAVPSGSYSHIAFVRVYATCRLRRIWFDGNGPDQSFPWEFDLFSAD